MKQLMISRLSLILAIMVLAACSDTGTKSEKTEAQNTEAQNTEAQNIENTKQGDLSESLAELEVYKDPNCGCCVDWITHIEKQGFSAKAYDTQELAQLKVEKGIPAAYQSCHTAISEQGFVFEGHVPAKYIEKFLKEKPEGAFGLTVPSMPVGSPGMEVGDKFMPYKVFQLNLEAEPSVYAEVNTYAEQF